MVLVIIKNWDHTKESLLAAWKWIRESQVILGSHCRFQHRPHEVLNGLPDHNWQRFRDMFMNIWMPSWDRVRDIVGGVTTVIRTIIDVIKGAVD